MMRPRRLPLMLPILSAALFLLTAAQPGRTTPSVGAVVSEFKTDTDGWAVWNQAADGLHDAEGLLAGRGREPGESWYWSAPAKFRGDRSAAGGGSLFFEPADGVRRGPRADGPAVILSGGGLTLGCEKPQEREDGAFLSCSAALRPGPWRNMGTGEPASVGELREVLGRLEQLLIRGIRHSNAREGRLRKVALFLGPDPKLDAAAAPPATLRVDTSLVDFGKVGAGFTHYETFDVINPGSTPVTFNVLLKQKADPAAFRLYLDHDEVPPDGGLNPIVEPNQRRRFEVRYDPPRLNKGDSAQVIIRAEGMKKPLKVKLKGKGIAPLEAPRFKNFGKVRVGTTTGEQSIVVINNTVDSVFVRLAFVDALDQFSISGPEDLVAVPSGTLVLKAAFHPTRGGKAEAKLRILDDNSGMERFAPLEITLRGEGTAGPPVFSVDSTTLDFGNVSLGTATSYSLEIRNSGADNLTVTFPELPAPYSWAVPPPSPLVLGPLDVKELEIVYAPQTDGRHDRSFILQSDDPAHRQITIRLLGAATGTYVAFDPPSLDFGTAPLGTGVERTLRIINVAPFDVAVRIENPVETHPLQFEWFVTIPGEFNGTIPAGGELILPIWFGPAEEGPRPTTMLIRSRPADILTEEIEDTLTLTGFGLPIPQESVLRKTPRKRK